MRMLTSATIILGLTLSTFSALAQKPAQGGGMGAFGKVAPGAPQFSTTFAKLFGEHTAFTAVMNAEVTENAQGQTFTSPSKVSFLDGKSRMEFDASQTKGPGIPEGMANQLKTMGMNQMIVISNPDKNISYLIYPGLQSYAEIAPEGGKPVDSSKIKLDSTELGKETVAGHPCVKSKVMITDQDGKPQEATVWAASDMKKFPVRILTGDENAKATLTFSEIKFEKPDASLFAPPANFTRYDNFQAMIQEAVMKRMQGGRALPTPNQ